MTPTCVCVTFRATKGVLIPLGLAGATCDEGGGGGGGGGEKTSLPPPPSARAVRNRFSRKSNKRIQV